MVDHPYSLTVYRPFNLNPIINFEKMGDFPTLKKGKSEKSGCLPPQTIWAVATLYCFKFVPKKISSGTLKITFKGAD